MERSNNRSLYSTVEMVLCGMVRNLIAFARCLLKYSQLTARYRCRSGYDFKTSNLRSARGNLRWLLERFAVPALVMIFEKSIASQAKLGAKINYSDESCKQTNLQSFMLVYP